MTAQLWRRIVLICALSWGALITVSSIISNWFFRMELAYHQGRDLDMVWSLTKGQALDIVEGAGSNIRNMILHLPGPTVPGASPSNTYASNTINVWINSAAYQGIPLILLVVAALALIAVAVYSVIALRRINLRESGAAQHGAA
jgi:hypothetical protein